MPDAPLVYRRAEIARWTAIFALPVAVVSGIVVALAGASWHGKGLGVVVLCAALFGSTFYYAIGFKRYGRHPDDRIATSAETWPRVARRTSGAVVSFVAYLVVFNTTGSLTWWLLPGVFGVLAVSSALTLAALTAWERRHPGALPVTDYDWFKNDCYVWREDATEPPPTPRVRSWAGWLVGNR